MLTTATFLGRGSSTGIFFAFSPELAAGALSSWEGGCGVDRRPSSTSMSSLALARLSGGVEIGKRGENAMEMQIRHSWLTEMSRNASSS